MQNFIRDLLVKVAKDLIAELALWVFLKLLSYFQ
jgi:hypothetical protein